MKNIGTATMSISLPKDMKEYVRRRTREEHYGTPSDYIRGLIREDLKRDEEELLEKKLLEGLASGPSTTMTAAEWKKMRTAFRSRLRKRR